MEIKFPRGESGSTADFPSVLNSRLSHGRLFEMRDRKDKEYYN